MARRGSPPKRKVIPDPIYKNDMVTQLINKILMKGKKGISEANSIWKFKNFKDKTKEDPLTYLKNALIMSGRT